MQNLEIIRMQLISFGKFRDRTIELSPGLNLLEGPNEAGKSTIQAFLTGMFYGFFQPGAKRRSYTPHRDKYQPWDGGSYRGVLVCRNEERTWRIERTFDKDSESVKVYDDLTGDDLTLDFAYNTVTRQVQVGEKLLGLSKTAFNNTANIAQMTCASVAQESGFSAEVSDKLLSMMKTADSSLSLSAVIHQLDSKAEQIGSPKKSKTPYGIESLREKELVEELEEAEKNEAEYQNLCEQSKSLSVEIQQLEKEKSLLEAQIRESAAKELGGRYLKAQNLRVRIERIEKEQEKYRIYQDVDPEIIDQAQKRLGAKAQITRTLEKYRRALEELNHRIQELNNLYRTLEVSGADEETLSQFDLMFERHKNLEQLRDELYQLQIKQHDYYQSKALDQQTRSTVVTASRGTIYDRNGNELAVSQAGTDEAGKTAGKIQYCRDFRAGIRFGICAGRGGSGVIWRRDGSGSGSIRCNPDRNSCQCNRTYSSADFAQSFR